MKTWMPSHIHSHNSLLDGLAKPKQIADRCNALGYKSCTLTDHGNVSGAITFSNTMRENGIKPIIGCELYVSKESAKIREKENRKHSHLVVLTKNIKGWYDLIKIISASNSADNFYYQPRLSLDELTAYCHGNLVAYSGHVGSDLANVLFDSGESYHTDEQDFKADLKFDPVTEASYLADKMKEMFGKDNFFIEIQTIDSKTSKPQLMMADILREVSARTGIPCVATADAHYAQQSDNIDHHVLLSSSLNRTIPDLVNDPNAPLKGFFDSDMFYIPSVDTLIESGNTEEEIENANLISDMCDDYDLNAKPNLPKFEWTNGLSEQDYLLKLCREGYERRRQFTWDKTKYGERVKKELSVIHKAGLEGYFLIVQDYVNYAKMQGQLVGPARGSGGGSLVCYLLGITEIDPIPHDLIFERFYNEGRNTENRVSLPDIDVDFPVEYRDRIIEYIKNKYGPGRVCQMATFGRMMGRGALKEVLRAHAVCDHLTANMITKDIPDEADISDELEGSGETSILRWTLENMPNVIKDYCTLEEDGSYSGEYSAYFEQAIRLEGTFKSRGKHAAGLIISGSVLSEVCPMIYDKKTDQMMAGMEMDDLESMGHVKFDLLGVACLSKLQGINNLLRYGVINPPM